jgi:hypothetical protein
LRRNKKALSEIVGYTLLIVIALAMAGMVYTFLKIYIPKEQIQCTEDINLIVEDVSCSVSGGLTLTLANRGLFKADDAYIRLGNPNSKIRPQLNKGSTGLVDENGMLGLNPGSKTIPLSYPVSAASITAPGTYMLEVEPAVKIEGRTILCDKAIITQQVACTA